MKKQRTKLVVVALLGLVFGFTVGVYVGRSRGIPFVEKFEGWSIGIYTGKSPVDMSPAQGASNPVLTAAEVTDVKADYVADPFMILDDDGKTWCMFFEVKNSATRQGDIGLATSTDGLGWAYKQIVLDEDFHLSYPYVFKTEDGYRMIPESNEADSVRLYKAVRFPTEWECIDTLIEGAYVDPSLLNHDNRWWLFVSNLKNDTLYLYVADELEGPWSEHPQSPVVKADANIARPGGRVISYDGRILRYTQDTVPEYGNQLRAFEITELTPDTYKEKEVADNPVLKASGSGWNADGMHHIDPHPLDENRWIACVDGKGAVWKIGLRY